MVYPIVLTLIVIIVLFATIATSSAVTKLSEASKIYKEASFSFKVERALADAVEALCISSPTYCKDRDNGSYIDLSYSDVSPYLPASFENSNLLGGTFYDIRVTDGHRTIVLYHSIPDGVKRRIYLDFYEGKGYGTLPQCVSGSKDTDPPCSDNNVYHEYPSSLEFRRALR